MEFDMKNTEVKGYTTVQLLDQIDRLLNERGESMVPICIRLVELEKRNVSHKIMYQGTYSRFRAIASGALSHFAADILAGQDKILDELIGMPLEEQKAIALGKPLQVAEAIQGKIVLTERKIEEIPLRRVSQVIKAGKYVPYSEQRKIVAREVKVAQTSRPIEVRRAPSVVSISADKKTGELIINGCRIAPAALVPALGDLGYFISHKSAKKVA